mmetsp:Transcript_61149/g.144410  ORF Transcript_61149/g.144410 Transcript_61149/m.144410 type:complete len:374 (+) Transcript_61149:2500-3621(+)
MLRARVSGRAHMQRAGAIVRVGLLAVLRVLAGVDVLAGVGVVRVVVQVQIVQAQVQPLHGTRLQGQVDGLALAVLHEHGGLDVAAPAVVGLDATADVVALLDRARDEQAQGLGLIAPAVQARRLTARATDAALAELDADKAGVSGLVQWHARLHDHGAADATFGQVGLRGLVDLHAADQLGRQQRVVEGAVHVLLVVPAGGSDGLSVQRCVGHLRVGAADRHRRADTEVAANRNPRNASQRLPDVGVGQLAHVFRRHRVDHGAGILFDVGSRLQRCTDAGDDHLFELRGCGVLGPAGQRQGQQGQRHGGRDGGGSDLHSLFLVSGFCGWAGGHLAGVHATTSPIAPSISERGATGMGQNVDTNRSTLLPLCTG